MHLQIHMLPILSDNYTYILVCNEDVAVIDPGEAKPILAFLSDNKLSLSKIFCTHHHPDHIAGNLALKEQTGCSIYGSVDDQKRIPGIDHTLEEGAIVKLGSTEAIVMRSWGHTIGHISYFFQQEKKLFSGDSLFSGGCGRLFEGTPQQMWDAFQAFSQLDNHTEVYCGHEYTKNNLKFALSVDANNQDLISYSNEIQSKNRTIPTTISLEKKINPFMRCHDQSIRKSLALENAADVEVFAKLRQLKDQF